MTEANRPEPVPIGELEARELLGSLKDGLAAENERLTKENVLLQQGRLTSHEYRQLSPRARDASWHWLEDVQMWARRDYADVEEIERLTKALSTPQSMGEGEVERAAKFIEFAPSFKTAGGRKYWYVEGWVGGERVEFATQLSEGAAHELSGRLNTVARAALSSLPGVDLKERGRIVAWLRKKYGDGPTMWDRWDRGNKAAYKQIADAIERGDHLSLPAPPLDLERHE